MGLALLRGVNVGGKNRLPMAELVAIVTAAGCTEARTYIQSGNVVFRTTVPEAELAARIGAGILARFGMKIPVIVRSGEELQRACRNNPFARARVPEEMLHVYFLAETPDPAAVERLDPGHSPGDSFVVEGREIFLHLPGGVAPSKLTNAYFDRTLETTSTLRNWKTCCRLASMMGI